MFQPHAALAWRDHDAGEMGEVGEQLRCGRDDLTRIVRANVVFELLSVDLLKRLDREQGIDK